MSVLQNSILYCTLYLLELARQRSRITTYAPRLSQDTSRRASIIWRVWRRPTYALRPCSHDGASDRYAFIAAEESDAEATATMTAAATNATELDRLSIALGVYGPWPGGRPAPVAGAGSGWELWTCPACQRNTAAQSVVAALCAELGPAAAASSPAAAAAAEEEEEEGESTPPAAAGATPERRGAG